VNPAATSTLAAELAMPVRLAALATSTRTALRSTGAMVEDVEVLAERFAGVGVVVVGAEVVVVAVVGDAVMLVWSTEVGLPAMATPAVAPSRTVMTTVTHELFMIRKP